MVTPLTRKLLRDLVHLRGQMVAIILVVASGVSALVMMRGMMDSLAASQMSYYEAYRFADVFVQLTRAPDALATRIAAIPGVQAVEPRVVTEVVLDVPGLGEPATGRLVSVRDRPAGMLNALHLRRGRMVEAGSQDEVVASEAFAEANRLIVGDQLGAIVNGRWRVLRIVGIGLSPEYIYQLGAGNVYPDDRHFGVLWMSRSGLGPALDLEGAFNDVALALSPGASEPDVIARLDRLLAPYGGLGAYGRSEQLSHRYVSDEIAQNKVSGVLLGYIFLAVASFLLNMVLSRLVGTQREQIGVLKAFGYSNGAIAGHFLLLGLLPVLAGAALGIGVGRYLGGLVTGIYEQYFRFPVLQLQTTPDLLLTAILVSVVAAGAGAMGAVRRAFSLAPAVAMQPEPPVRYGRGWLDRLGIARGSRPPVRMIVRSLERHPFKAMLSVLGIALSVAILVTGRSLFDAMPYLMDHGFQQAQRQDLAVTFVQPRSAGVRQDLAHLPGVLSVEPYRAVPARLRFGSRSHRIVVMGLPRGGELRRLVDRDGRVVALPESGLLLTAKLAEMLGARPGDTVRIETLDGKRRVLYVVLSGTVDELLGVSAYMPMDQLSRMLGEGTSISGANLRDDPDSRDELYAQLKRTPAVAGVSLRESALRAFNETIAATMNISTTVLIVFACVIAAGVIYNGLRISLSERGRELASLRVLGFTQGEVAVILLGEQGVLLVLALPVGLVMGYGLSALVASLLNTELYRLPLVLTGKSYLMSAAVVVLTGLGSALLVGGRLRRLDLVAVLKSRE